MALHLSSEMKIGEDNRFIFAFGGNGIFVSFRFSSFLISSLFKILFASRSNDFCVSRVFSWRPNETDI